MERNSIISSPKRGGKLGKVRFMERYPTQILEVKISKRANPVPGPGAYEPIRNPSPNKGTKFPQAISQRLQNDFGTPQNTHAITSLLQEHRKTQSLFI
jgi:hypothetical protein